MTDGYLVFRKGDRVQYSPAGLEHMNEGQRRGTVMRNSQGKTIAVTWDGLKTVRDFAARFIEHSASWNLRTTSLSRYIWYLRKYAF